MLQLVLAHPLLVFFTWPIPAKAKLQETIAGNRPGFDDAPHHRTVAGEVALEFVGSVGVSVKVNHDDVAKPVLLTHRRHSREGDRVVATQDHGHNASAGDFAHPVIDCLARFFPHSVAGNRIAKIDHVQVIKNLHAQIEVIGAGVIRVCSQRPRAKASAWSIGSAVIPRGTNDRNIGLDGIKL